MEPDERVELPQEQRITVSQSLKQPFSYLNLINKTNSYEFGDKLWHLKFQANESEWAVFLNPLIDISVYRTPEDNFNKINADYVVNQQIEWQKDIPLRTSMLPAIGTWGDYSFQYPNSHEYIYILKVKRDLQLEYYKIQILDALKDNYSLRYSKLGSGQESTILIPKEKNYTHTYFSVEGLPEVIRVEPQKSNWQMCFSYGFDSLKYNTQGRVIKQITDSIALYPKILLNKQSIKLHFDTLTPFESIDYFYAKEQNYVAYEQITNPFLKFNKQTGKYYIDDRIVILCKVGDIYIKVKAEDYVYIYPADFTLNLVAKSL